MKELKQKIVNILSAKPFIDSWKTGNQKIVFTNGCFDIFHYGHLHLLFESKKLGNKLVVGLNSDLSVKSLKGKTRPIYNQKQRSAILSAISFIDLIIIFSDKTPIKLIKTINPDIITKGSDYKINEVVGRKVAQNNGGKVVLIPLVKGLSSTSIVKKI